MPDIQKSLKSLKNIPKPSTLSGSLGLSPTVINVPSRLGFSYVRLLGNTNEVIQAYNSTVSATFDIPVTVQWDGTKYVVIGRDVNRYTSWGSSPYLPLHGTSHAFGGGDTTWILQEQFYPLRVYPSGSSLQIAPYVYNWLGTWKSGGNTGTSTITLPSDPTKQSVMLLYINGATSNPTWIPGTEAPINLTAKSDLIPYLPSFQMSLGIPLVMARIPSGTTSWTWDNLYDVRQFFGGFSSTSGSSSTGSSSGGDVYGPATNHDSYLPQWNGANSKILKDGLPVVTSIGTPGSDTNIPTEKAVRTAISAISGSSSTGSNYALPTGSSSILGGFRVGTGVYVNTDGTINSSGTNYSLPTGSASILGGFKVGSGLSVSAGVLSATGVGTGSSGPPGFQTLTDGTAIDWNLALGSAKVTLGGNRTLNNPSNMGAGEFYFLEVFQDTTGSRHISTWGSAYKFPNNVKPTLSVAKNREDVIYFGCDGTYMLYSGIQLNVTNSGTSLGYQSNMSTWLEARLQSYSNIGGTPCVDGDAVYQTVDQSTAAMNGVQTTLANRPIYKDNIINGNAVWRFDGSNSLYLQMTGMSPGLNVSFFFVLIPGTTTPIGIFDGAPNVAPDWIRNYGAGIWDEDNAPQINFTLSNTSPVLLEFVHFQDGSGRTVKYYKNGTLITTATNVSTATLAWSDPTLGTINLGNDGKYQGDMAAFLCFHETISDANRALVESYLKGVYGIT